MNAGNVGNVGAAKRSFIIRNTKGKNMTEKQQQLQDIFTTANRHWREQCPFVFEPSTLKPRKKKNNFILLEIGQKNKEKN
jgi:hypothetical protein